MSYVVLARKYRPQTFAEVYAQDHIVRIFKHAIELDRVGQAYLFTGSRGVGKTSVARILAKSLNCMNGKSINPCNTCANCLDITNGVSADVSEIDGASNTGVDDIRNLQHNLQYHTSQSLYRIVIIDEVHMLSKNAFNALLKTLEEPPPNVVFIFATTEPHKMLATIISRCQRFDFKKIPTEPMVKRLKEIAFAENINFEDTALYLIAKMADGGMRDALSLMDQVVSYGLQQITYDDVQSIFGLVDIDVFNSFMSAIADKNPGEILNLYTKTSEQGLDTPEFINNFLEYLRKFVYIKMNIDQPDISRTQKQIMENLSEKFTEDEILYIMNFLIETKNNLRTTSSPDVLAELAFIKIAKISEMKSLKSILETLSQNPLSKGNVVTTQQNVVPIAPVKTVSDNTAISNPTTQVPIETTAVKEKPPTSVVIPVPQDINQIETITVNPVENTIPPKKNPNPVLSENVTSFLESTGAKILIDD
jgi:DNA polymerase-3 subunit gamma/tau